MLLLNTVEYTVQGEIFHLFLSILLFLCVSVCEVTSDLKGVSLFVHADRIFKPKPHHLEWSICPV